MRDPDAGPGAGGGRLPSPSCDALHPGAGGVLWIGGGRGQLLRWDGAAVESWHLPRAGRVQALLEDAHGVLWIGADPGGLYRWRDGVVEVYPQRRGHDLQRVLSLLEDREGSLWVGSSLHGLHQLRVGEAVAFGGPGAPDHPLGAPVVPVLDDGAGGVWTGVACGGVVHLGADGAVSRYAGTAGFDNLCVWSLAADGEGGLWVGTLGGGLYRLRDGRAHWQRGPPTPTRAVHALLPAADGSLYAGTDDGVFRVTRGGANAAYARLPGTAGLRVFHLAVAPDGALWLGSDDGAWVLRPGAAAARLHPRLAGVPVRAIHFDDAGAVWLGTYGHGLLRYHDRHLARLTAEQGLPDNVVSLLAEDRLGRFWLTGNRGVARISRAQLEAVARGERPEVEAVLYTARDGMPVSETNGGGQPAGRLTADGLLWVPTIAGLARFDTRRSGGGGLPPPVRIEEVRLGGETVPLGERLELPAGARDLEVVYTGLSFTDPDRLRFRYRLQGLDREWTEAGRRRVAYYHFLPAGDHTFRVVARNADGVWSRQAAKLDFTVRPRFVETPWAWLLGVLAVAALVAGVAVLRRRLLETRRRLEDANRHLEELAALDPLTGIPNRRGLMSGLEREWKRAVRFRRSMGVLMIDLDRFKQYNDRHGHLAGDRCLRRVVEILDGGLRRVNDLLTRFGGEELAAVVPEVSEEELAGLAEALRRRVEAAAIPHGAAPEGPWVTVSVGGAVMVPQLGDRPDGLLSTADRALYAAKEAGRNRVVVVPAGKKEGDPAAGGGNHPPPGPGGEERRPVRVAPAGPPEGCGGRAGLSRRRS